MDEPIYCFNCDNEAIFYVDWRYTGSPKSEPHRTFMCQPCKDAFEFGQCTPEIVHSIDDLND